MRGKHQLRWVQRNRARASHVRDAGALIKGLADRIEARSGGPASEVATRLAGLVDDQFRRHCRVAEVRDGKLLIHVDQAELVYSLRRLWEDPLREALPALCRSRSVYRVAFAFGNAGAVLGDGQGVEA